MKKVKDFFIQFLKQIDPEKREWMVGMGFSLLIHVLPFLVLCCFLVPRYGGGGVPGVTMADLSMLTLSLERPGGAATIQKPPKNPIHDVTAKTPDAVKSPSIPLIADAVPVKEKIEDSNDDLSENRLDKKDKKEKKESADASDEKSDSTPVHADVMNDESFRNAMSDASGNTVFVSGGSGDPSLLNQYREMIRNVLRSHWVYSMPGYPGEIREAQISFVVMSNGELRGLRIDRRSGDDAMDSRAVSVIQTSSPVWPHPAGVNLPFIGMTILIAHDGIY